MGPEGGQFSIFFAKGAKFEFADWFTPAVIDTLPFKVAQPIPGPGGVCLRVRPDQLLGHALRGGGEPRGAPARHRGRLAEAGREGSRATSSLVAYETDNKITNAGKNAWKKDTGLLSIWILGMFNPSPSTTIVVPIKAGPESELGVKVTSDYFGSVPPDRLVVKDDVIYFSADGKYRSKIGINPKRSKARARAATTRTTRC